jgi:hypothetical protein
MKDKDKNGTSTTDIDLCGSLSGDIDDYFSIFSGDEIGTSTSGEDGSQYSGLVSEELMEVSQRFGFELNEHENSIVRWAERAVGKRRRGAKKPTEETLYVTHEDFEVGPERDAFLLIYGHAENLFESNDAEKQASGIEFFFGRNSDEITFEEAAGCIDNYIRTDVIRLRIMFEFWLRDWHFELPFSADVLPSRIEMSSAQYGGMIGVDIARECWFEPGIRLSKLIQLVNARNENITENDIIDSLKNLIAYHIISQGSEEHENTYYTTGKNPILKLEEVLMERGKIRVGLEKIQWSRMF